MMQTADFGNCNNLADRLYWTWIRRIFIQRQMKTASVIVTGIEDSQIEALRSNIAELRTLRTELSSQREKLKLLREDMRTQVQKLRRCGASKQGPL